MGEKSRRERAAEARGVAQASEKRRERTVRFIGGAAVVVIMAAIIGVAVYASSNSPSNDASGSLDGIVQPDLHWSEVDLLTRSPLRKGSFPQHLL